MANTNSGSASSGDWWKYLLAAVVAVGLLAHFHVIRLPWQKTDVQKMLDNPTLYTPDPADIRTDAVTDVSYVENIVLIFFKPDTSDREMQKVVDSVDGEVVGCLKAIDQLQVKVEANTLSELNDICEKLEREACVEFAVYDEALKVDGDLVPNDPWGTEFGRSVSWVQNQPVDANWWVNATDAMYAWDSAQDFDAITIGVVDNGFDTSHPELSGKITGITENNSVEDHGTHVAGIIGARHNNGEGISGIVPRCEMITADWELTDSQNASLAAQGGQWSTTNHIIGQTVMLIENGAKVVNISAGSSAFVTGAGWDYNGIGRQASMYLCQLLARGYDFVVVQSAGNGNASHVAIDAVYNGSFCSITPENCAVVSGISPGDIMGRIIVVGAAGMDGRGGYVQPSWSNAGARVDLCAPGVNVYATLSRNRYGYLSGTSMAAPVVTGTASLVWAANPDLTGADVKRIVCENTKDLAYAMPSDVHPFSDVYPMVNTQLAVQAALDLRGARSVTPEELYAPVLAAYRNGKEQLQTSYAVYAAGSNRFYQAHRQDSPFYYAFRDIDGNGVPELLIGTFTFWSGKIEVVDIFCMNGDTPVPLFRPMSREYLNFHEGEIPAFMRIFPDGTIFAKMGFSEDIPAYMSVRIAADGCSTSVQRGMIAMYTYLNPSNPNDPDAVYYTYSRACPNPGMAYDEFLFWCVDETTYQNPDEAYGIHNDYEEWAMQMCSGGSAPVTPGWIAF